MHPAHVGRRRYAGDRTPRGTCSDPCSGPRVTATARFPSPSSSSAPRAARAARLQYAGDRRPRRACAAPCTGSRDTATLPHQSPPCFCNATPGRCVRAVELGVVLQKKGNLDGPESQCRASLCMNRGIRGKEGDHRSIAASLRELGVVRQCGGLQKGYLC